MDNGSVFLNVEYDRKTSDAFRKISDVFRLMSSIDVNGKNPMLSGMHPITSDHKRSVPILTTLEVRSIPNLAMPQLHVQYCA